MAALPEGLTQADIDEYARLDAGIKKLADKHASLKDKIKKAHKADDLTEKKTYTYPSEKYGTVVVKIGLTKNVDSEALEKKYPADKSPEFWVPKLDVKLMDATILDKFRTKITHPLTIEVAE